MRFDLDHAVQSLTRTPRVLRELLSQHTGRHPELGAVTLQQLLATWVVHDLDHVRQLAEAIAHQYADQVGPWRQYLPILTAT